MQWKGRAGHLVLAAAMVSATATAQSDRVQYVPPSTAYRALLDEGRASTRPASNPQQAPSRYNAAPAYEQPQAYGTEIPAQTYANVVNAYQAQVQDLQSQVAALMARVDSMERTIDTYSVQVSALKSDLNSQMKSAQLRIDASLQERNLQVSQTLSNQIRAQVVAACAAERATSTESRAQPVMAAPAAVPAPAPAPALVPKAATPRADTIVFNPPSNDPALGTRLPSNVKAPMQATLATVKAVPEVALAAPAVQTTQKAERAEAPPAVAAAALNDVILRFDDFATARSVYGSLLKGGVSEVLFKSWGDQYLLQFGRFRNYKLALQRRDWIEKTTGLKADVVPVVESPSATSPT